MSSSRAGIPQQPTFIAADGRIPFPHTDQVLRCRTNPQMFEIEDIHNAADTPHARQAALTKANRACAGCPIVNGCLKWALANPDLTATGVWAATTARDRTALRDRLVARLGADWVAAVVDQDRRRRERQREVRVVPPTTRELALARLELESIPTRPEPYNRWTEPITPDRAASNRHALVQAITNKAA
ncbi:WhiB family transcriptional regulator [Streptomyces sp. NBC_01768]|uniref:WhiB family transcriptional regulator n=1 Tax=Streptomyces sp. NBC_01768 TaxID=2975938 RepID=UPI002DDA1443|nr:WhiB family transcriptional regulator [Streptomyces sp. NBC_01768]WSC34051.1 WhiB family transcriptional regulator [Streptomyces sp. NBC_01768]